VQHYNTLLKTTPVEAQSLRSSKFGV